MRDNRKQRATRRPAGRQDHPPQRRPAPLRPVCGFRRLAGDAGFHEPRTLRARRTHPL